MSQRGQKLVDGYGGRRLAKIIEAEALKLRPVHSEDCERVLKWRNDDSVRAVSFSKAKIEWKEHISWFQERIRHPYFYIALNQDDLPIGQVRFDQKEEKIIISVVIDVDWRYRGYGGTLIRKGCEEIFKNSEVTTIYAYIEPDNEASKGAFIRAGFKERGDSVQNGFPAKLFILEKG